ncbi:Capsule polysaccharide export ATP-binding protein ctrD (Capsular-polysaccharide-transporting ATPase) [Legionella busanensis]|uniref:Capsule polysaccharide export ATP-binding protein ctrD (Capsular-polysaccharide-transporting ATPase) n=1 Tax=Legionella busanensis TaxID=190655 RepID=A0A378KA08_9GAMM|nr:ATP-binding cassette domain-containing protein [Legionella busanensis]STX81349.1 Capsule polysaccharide export ATP-binding protein ctrD (Capsular-polysaccharide-transporting ATPase) [Legionella busanensis]
MLGFINGTKYFKNLSGLQIVLNNATFLVEEHQKVGILGGIGAGKSTVVKILAGMLKLDSGVLINKRTAWPLGYAGAFHPFLTASENIKIIAQLNYLDPFDLRAFCQDFAELSNPELNLKMSAYSGSMRAKLGFALSLAIPCDFFLADEKLSVGDDDFRIKCEVALELRLKKSGLIFFTRNSKLVQNICDKYGLLHNGQIKMYQSYEEACYFFEQDLSLI